MLRPIICNLASITAMLIAGTIAILGLPGWGWFILASIIMATTIITKENR